MPRQKKVSIQTLKPSCFRPLHEKQFTSDSFPEIKSVSIFHTDIKLISTTYTKNKSISMPTQSRVIFGPHMKTKYFEHPHKKQVNRSSHWKQVKFAPNKKTSQFRSPH